MKDNILIQLNTSFNDYCFYEDGHYYTYQGKKVKTSVTQFIENKHLPFDKEKISAYVAQRDNKDQKQILKEWEEISTIACEVGTLFHLRSEQLSAGKHLEVNYDHIKDEKLKSLVELKLNNLIPLQDKFFKDIHNKLIPVKTEFTVGYEDVIAGNIDLLCYNLKDDEFQIWDYKTNKDIKTDNNYQTLLEEFNGLPDCELSKYSIQLGIYKNLLKRKLNINIGKCYIVWFNENNSEYLIFKCLDLDSPIEQALDNLIKETKNGNNSN